MEPWLIGRLTLCFLVMGELGGIGIVLWILLPLLGYWLRSRRESAWRSRTAPAQLNKKRPALARRLYRNP